MVHGIRPTIAPTINTRRTRRTLTSSDSGRSSPRGRSSRVISSRRSVADIAAIWASDTPPSGMAVLASSGNSGSTVRRGLRRRIGVVLGEFLGTAGELEGNAIRIMEVERPHVHTRVHRRRHLGLALVVIEHRPDAHALVLEPLPVLVELLRRHVEGQVVHGAHGAHDVTDPWDRFRRRKAWDPVGSVGEPEERNAVAAACIEEEVLSHATRQIQRLNQRHAKHIAVKVDGTLHVGADQRHVVDSAELEFGIWIVWLDHVAPPRNFWPRTRSESNIRFRFDQWPIGRSPPVTVSPREQLPTLRGRQTQAAIDAAARAVIARKGILATTISDIAAEAGKSTASFYNYYDSKEAMVREWAVRFRDEARERSRAASEPGLTNWERSYQAAAAHWNTYRNRLAEIISVSQLAMISDDFAEYWADICSLPIGLITQMVKQARRHGFCSPEDDPHLVSVAMVSMLNQFCYTQLSGDAATETADDDACITTLANIFYRTIYHKVAALT